jgi:hypothetical protein
MVSSHPRILPGTSAWWRPPETLFVDLPDGTTLRIADAPRELATAIMLLDGTRSIDDAAAAARGPFDRVAQIVHRLTRAGAMSTVAVPHGSVELIGCGQVGAAIARLLVADTTVSVLVRDAPGETDRPPRGWRPAAQLRSALVLEGCGPDRIRAVGDDAAHTADLSVVATNRVEPDRFLTDALVRAGQPHLVASFVGSSVAVGPLVVPGETPCLRCGDIAAARRDPDWPARLAARVGRRVELDGLSVQWCAATIVSQIMSFFASGRPDVLGSMLLTDVVDRRLRTRSWRVHPECGCTTI